jgi:hypothetical protein
MLKANWPGVFHRTVKRHASGAPAKIIAFAPGKPQHVADDEMAALKDALGVNLMVLDEEIRVPSPRQQDDLLERQRADPPPALEPVEVQTDDPPPPAIVPPAEATPKPEPPPVEPAPKPVGSGGRQKASDRAKEAEPES